MLDNKGYSYACDRIFAEIDVTDHLSVISE